MFAASLRKFNLNSAVSFMNIRSAVLILFCCNLFLSVTAQPANKNTSELTLFTLNKKPVNTGEFIYLYRKNNQDKAEEFTRPKIEEYLNLFINFKLKVEEAKHRGQDTTAAFHKEYNSYREELRKPYLPDTRMIDSLVRLTYDRMLEEVKAAHILINLKPDATPEDTLTAHRRISELRTRIIQGEDFETLAASVSEDPSARLNKGDLGYFTALQMVFPFEQAAFTTPVGNVSLPVRTQFGYHLVKVIDRRPTRGEVEVSHIMLRTGEAQDNEKAKNTIFDIYDQLQKGVKWEELCNQYSQDPSSKDKGGRLKPFGVGAMRGVPEFEQAAFYLKEPGDISDPVKTQFGWHIIRLESRIPLPPLKEMEASLRSRVTREDRAQISRQAIQNKMRKEFDFKENETVKTKVLALGDTTLRKGKWRADLSTAADDVLFSMQGKTYPAQDFLKYAEQKQKPNSLSPGAYLTQLYTQYVDEVQGRLMEEKIKQKNPDYSFLLKEYYEGILLFEIMEKEVWNKASEDSVGQHQYFSAHADNYKAKERVKGKIFTSSSRSAIDQLKTLVEKGDSASIQQFVTSQKIRTEAGAFEKNDRPVLSKVTWGPGAYVAENNGTYHLVWITSLIPPGPRSFAEARAAVISDYQNFVEQQWIAHLKKKFPVKINKKGKQYVFEQLVKK
jgi:peptidyl-prolyl cis-trans isomerase SurA